MQFISFHKNIALAINRAHEVKYHKAALLINGNIDTCNVNNFVKFCIFMDNKVVPIENLDSKEIYQMIVTCNFKEPIAKDRWNHKEHMHIDESEWKCIYNAIYKTSIDRYSREFQYKVINRYLPVNSLLYKWKLIETNKCSYCGMFEENLSHLFVECTIARNLYFAIQEWLQNVVLMPAFNAKIIMFGDLPVNIENRLMNQILIIYKIRVDIVCNGIATHILSIITQFYTLHGTHNHRMNYTNL